MKTITTLLLFVLATTATHSQNARYTEFMKQNIMKLDSAKTPEDFQTLANNFERIAAAEKDQWHPYYYAAYSLAMKSFIIKDKSQVDGICDKADEYVSMAESLNNNNSEITTMKAMLLESRMGVDQSRGMTLGPRTSTLLQKAIKEEPLNNPRALTQMAQMTYYTPVAFGGGKEPGIVYLKKAVEAYDTFKPANDLDPNWGKKYAQELLAEWSK